MDEKEWNETLGQSQMVERQMAINDIKYRLPMLYTARGNLIAPDGGKVRVSGKNAAKIMTAVSLISVSGKNITLMNEDWTCTFSTKMSTALREYGLVAEIMLAGYTLTV